VRRFWLFYAVPIQWQGPGEFWIEQRLDESNPIIPIVIGSEVWINCHHLFPLFKAGYRFPRNSLRDLMENLARRRAIQGQVANRSKQIGRKSKRLFIPPKDQVTSRRMLKASLRQDCCRFEKDANNPTMKIVPATNLPNLWKIDTNDLDVYLRHLDGPEFHNKENYRGKWLWYVLLRSGEVLYNESALGLTCELRLSAIMELRWALNSSMLNHLIWRLNCEAERGRSSEKWHIPYCNWVMFWLHKSRRGMLHKVHSAL